jgi:Predicted N-acetylglucosamine kinase
MKLVVEAGSTKTDSILISTISEEYPIVKSSGINPVTDPDFALAIDELLSHHSGVEIDQIIYYGSGCISDEVNNRVRVSMTKSLGYHPDIVINDDLLAVGHAMTPHHPGIIGILGTGSNVGYYDGQKVTTRVKSCGYLLGDEGSGYQIGKAIYRYICRDQLPQEVKMKILQSRDISAHTLIETAYSHPNQRTFIASFASYTDLLPPALRVAIFDEVFDPFIVRMLAPLLKKYLYSIYLSGSIAYHFQGVLKEKLQKIDIIAPLIVSSPIEGLIRYHQDG